MLGFDAVGLAIIIFLGIGVAFIIIFLGIGVAFIIFFAIGEAFMAGAAVCAAAVPVSAVHKTAVARSRRIGELSFNMKRGRMNGARTRARPFR